MAGFFGGLTLDGHKALSLVQPLRDAPLSSALWVPLAQSAGTAARPCVQIGDRVRRGQVIARAPGAVPVHASSSGVVRAIGPRAVIHPSGRDGDCIEIDCDGRDESIALSPLPDWSALDPLALIDRIDAAGIVGLGGGVFPTALKLKRDAPLAALVLNGAECEPYIACDQALLAAHADEVLGGARVLMHVLKPARTLLAIEDSMALALAALAQQSLGEIELKRVPTRYPTGGERQLLPLLGLGVVPADRVPAEVGVLSVNVATARAVWHAVRYGEPLIERVVSVTGPALQSPRNLVVRIGTPIADLIAACGGYRADAQRLVVGGGMMGLSLRHDHVPVSKGCNSVVVLGPNEAIAEMPCIRCGACAEVCPPRLSPQLLHLALRAGQDADAARLNLSDCIECGLCSLVCPSAIPLAEQFRAGRVAARARAVEQTAARAAEERFERRKIRLAALEQARAARRDGADSAAARAVARAKARAQGAGSDAR
jgi:Na+-translocating ferredoxin:NAD+ oxidoreductase subunit C